LNLTCREEDTTFSLFGYLYIYVLPLFFYEVQFIQMLLKQRLEIEYQFHKFWWQSWKFKFDLPRRSAATNLYQLIGCMWQSIPSKKTGQKRLDWPINKGTTSGQSPLHSSNHRCSYLEKFFSFFLVSYRLGINCISSFVGCERLWNSEIFWRGLVHCLSISF